ncbi:hypothetical protein AMK59_3881 [Oryctes borbonicus]|uniref:MiT/TFE transcription factors N-terminal domain-containing protein n=1 Tax=Oryctes borbonicus TaxID=1629725 RepID=A0A0T6B8I8_9SCAR|nr:hypothetical protein AMK59_3881 [Oryctes borbonicus]
MTESGIDLGFDLSAYNIDFDFQNIDFEELLGTPKNQEFYELKSKTMPVTESPPNLKTATLESRTQLKLQLMREQALQEQERRQAQERAQRAQEQQQQQQRPTAPAVRVPLHSIDVPPQVLQVQTKLENPTRYYVMQKQKNQVKQYLSESFQQPTNNSLLSHLYPRVCPQQTNSAPGLTNNYSNGNTVNVNGLYGHSHPSYNTGASPSPSEAPPAMSPALSSGATSASEPTLPKAIPTSLSVLTLGTGLNGYLSGKCVDLRKNHAPIYSSKV